jgi:hypothetical protein
LRLQVLALLLLFFAKVLAVMRIAKTGMTYFAIIFGVGFVLGTIRVFLVVPQVGVRTAELIEEPIMFMVVLLAARWLVRRFTLELLRERLGAGIIGLGLLLTAEYALLRAQGLTLREDIARRDVVAGTLYLAVLLVFAVMPALVGRRRPGT